MPISIIVPVLNEGPSIRPYLESLRERADTAEIVVVDGTSCDATMQLAAGCCDQLLQTPPGRARQMNAGARAASGDVLWFLHADVTIPLGAVAEIESALRNQEIVGGFFRIRIPRSQWIYRLTDEFAHYAGLLLQMRCGDHGLFCRREIFEQIGGFPNDTFMEDTDFFRKLRRAGRLKIIPQRLVVSPRRYETIGPMRITFAFGLIGLLYFLHVPRGTLETMYRRLCCRS